MKKVLFAVLTLGLAVMLCGCGTKKVDLNEYFGYVITGGDGYAEITNKFDRSGLQKELMDITDLSVAQLTNDMLQIETAVDKGKWDKSDNLSNGDRITYTWDIDREMFKDKYGIIFECKDVKVEVQGLESYQSFDPFENIEIDFAGVEPYGYAWSEVPDDYEYKDIDIKIYTSGQGLSEGDTVRVEAVVKDDNSADLTEMCMEKYGKIPTRTEMEVTVHDLDKRVISLSDLSDETIDFLKKESEECIKSYVEKNWSEDSKFIDMEYVGDCIKYHLDLKCSDTYMIYKITTSSPDVTAAFNYYTYVDFSNLKIRSNGELIQDYTYGLPDRHLNVGSRFYLGYGSYEELMEEGLYHDDKYLFDVNIKQSDDFVNYKDVLK